LFGVLLSRTGEELDVNSILGLISTAAIDEFVAIHWSLVEKDVR